MTTFQNVWPVNEVGEIVTAAGVGSTTVTGYVAQDQIPVDSMSRVRLAGMSTGAISQPAIILRLYGI